MKKYYSILRPVGMGTAPRGFVSFENFENRTYIEEIGREAWGYLVYKEPIDNPEKWDLVEAKEDTRENLDRLGTQEGMTYQIRTCPRCGKQYNEYPALSRKDNKTEICPDCGTREAIEEAIAYEKGGK